MKKTVTVFGSSMPRPGETQYESAYKLGKLLGENGINVCSGGFQGIMDAVSKGAAEAGAEATGVTVSLYNAMTSKYLTREISCSSLFERLGKLIEIGDAFVVLQGGTGTLLELALVWEYMNKNMIPAKPFACHGSMWNEIAVIIENQIEAEGRRTGLLRPFDKIEDCAAFIIESMS